MKVRLPHVLTLWRTTGSDGMGGSAFAPPEQLRGRWESKAELFRDAQARETVTKAVVFVDRDFPTGSYLMLGPSNELDPLAVGASEVRGFESVPTVSGKSLVRKALL